LIHRALDVVFQYLPGLAAALLLIPLTAAALGLALDRSEVVSAKVWADRPAYTPKFASDRFASYDTPGQVEASLMQEMVSTDSFVAAVLTKTEPQYGSWSRDHRDQAAVDFRKDLTITSQAEHLFVISYRAARVQDGVARLEAVIEVFTTTVQELESGQVATAQSALQGQLDAARQAMNAALAQMESYKASHGISDAAALADPNYSQLQAQARSKTDLYLALQAQVDDAQASRAAVNTIQASVFHVVDPPAASPRSITRSTPAVKYALEALAAVAVAEALLVYVLARRDPSIRSLEDARRGAGLKPLGSTPVLASR
jgi:hypothetical protein